jgi:hypothetical protein
MGRKSAFESGIRDEQPGSYFLELRNDFFGFLGVKILKFFDADPGSGMETVRIRDGKKSDPGKTSRIRNTAPDVIFIKSSIAGPGCVSRKGQQYRNASHAAFLNLTGSAEWSRADFSRASRAAFKKRIMFFCFTLNKMLSFVQS